MNVSVKIKRICLLGILSFLTFSCNNSNQSYEPIPKKIDFNFDIRPILVQNCYLCHGPDASSRKANLRLDTYEGATAALKDGGYAVVPGKPNKSELISRITHTHEDKVMPPPEMNSKLSEREVDLLEKWIKQGAEWKPHWSFIKPDFDAEKHDIDFYVDNYLDKKELNKSPIANKNSLIRRVSYVLTGLPPLPEDVKKFVEDSSDDAYNKMVDRYLNSVAYGERWARHWMDLVRYAETKGHEFDYTITGAWKYRDYLIKAFNNDVSYDKLLKEHLAGDLLPEKRFDAETGNLQSHIATAFFAMGEGTHSPVDIRQDEANRIDNIIDVTSKTFQGLTVSCAKCHDHKFDPITAADYYAFYGIMESTRFTPLDAEFSVEKENAASALTKIQDYLKTLVSEEIDYKISKTKNPSNNKTDNLSNDYKLLGDFRNADFGQWKTSGIAFGESTTLGNPIINKSTGKLIALEEGKASSKVFGEGIFGALRSPDFILDSNFIGVKARGKHSTIRIIIDNFQLIQYPIYGDLTKSVNTSEWTNYTFNVEAWKGHKAYIEIITGNYNRHDFNFAEDAFVESKYAISYNDEWPAKVKTESDEPTLKQIADLNIKIKKGQIKEYFPELISSIDSTSKLAKKLKSDSFVYGVSDGFANNSPVFNRGRHQEPSEEHIPRRFLSALPLGDIPFKSEGSGRLELAEAMLNKENPLTSRVMVNRIWHHLFGRGIVETVDNFGLQGKLPSHPKLLDHLAIKFHKDGWSIKKIIKYIVTSETFKRSTKIDNTVSIKDPNNIYLASFPIRRLESEAIRDGVLVASGDFNPTVYGPPVPTYLTKFMQGRGRPEKSGSLNGDGRRSIYQEVRRNFLEPFMTTFDRPIPFTTFGKRDVTNVPSQSLILMNDPFVIEQAEIMAQALLEQKNLSFNQRIKWVYMRAFSRNPSEEELTNASKFIKAIEDMKTTDNNDAKIELEIWKEYCHSVFNLKEFLYLI